MNRRSLLQGAGLAALGLWLPTTALAAPGPTVSAPAGPGPGTARGKVLVVIFQRGAADGLSLLVPYTSPEYYAARPRIALARPGSSPEACLDLDGRFGLHPALHDLQSAFKEKRLAFVQGVGGTRLTRSHFDAQKDIETGAPGQRDTTDGFLNRALKASHSSADSPLRAVALQPTLPRVLAGESPTVAVGNLGDFRVAKGSAHLGASFEEMYEGAVDEALRTTATEAFDSARLVSRIRGSSYPAQHGAVYPSSRLGKRLRQIAQLIRADVGLEVAVTECSGWDTHVNQGGAQGNLAKSLRDWGDSVGAFMTDLQDRGDDVCVVTLTEFGRTVQENGSAGTDHGHGSAMSIWGGGVRGGRIHGRWDGLAPEHLHEGRELPVTTDHRMVMMQLLERQLGLHNFDTIFPDLALPVAVPAAAALRLFD